MSFVYLDYAAATPVDEAVLKSMQPFWQEKFHNPSALNIQSRGVKDSLEEARAQVARTLNVKPVEIIFTAGGTEANNLAIFGICGMYPDSHIVSSAIEHDSVLHAVQAHKNHTVVQPSKNGLVDVQDIQRAITDRTSLVSIMMVNNEVGTIQPIHEITKLLTGIREERARNGNKTPIFLHTDAAQASNYLDIDPHKLGVDLMTINGGKIYGPKQTGALFVRAGVDLRPLIVGGGQEWGKRSGTENVPGFIGFAAALSKAQKKRKSEYTRLEGLQRQLIDFLETQKHITINGSKKHRVPNNVHFTVEGYDNERLLYELENHGFIVAVGSACSASDDEPSHVLKAIGLSDEQARSSVRVSMGRQTTKKDIGAFAKTLKQLLKDHQ